MQISIIGTGNMGAGIATRALAGGHRVRLADRDPAKAKALAEAVQLRALETAQFGWLGQWYGPGARRANVTGWLKAPVPVMWNIEKK